MVVVVVIRQLQLKKKTPELVLVIKAISSSKRKLIDIFSLSSWWIAWANKIIDFLIEWYSDLSRYLRVIICHSFSVCIESDSVCKETICGWEIHSTLAEVESLEGKLLQSCGMSKYIVGYACQIAQHTTSSRYVLLSLPLPHPFLWDSTQYRTPDERHGIMGLPRGILKGRGSRQSGKWFFSVSGLTPTGLKNLNKVLCSGVTVASVPRKRIDKY